jgi:hypothetical protein
MRDILGYFVPPIFTHQGTDIWLSWIGAGLGNYICLPTVHFEHYRKTNTPKIKKNDMAANHANRSFSSSKYTWKKVGRHLFTDIKLLNQHKKNPFTEEQLIENLKTYPWPVRVVQDWSPWLFDVTQL